MLGKIDLIHTFPLASLLTTRVAKEYKIPTVLERCNAHTAFAYEIVRQECERLGLVMPPGHEHEFNDVVLQREKAEYESADYLLCPSEFVANTFRERGFPAGKLARFRYGFDEELCFARDVDTSAPSRGLRVLFAAGCAPRKGLHYALEAWLKSSASEDGTFLVAGEFIPGYAEKLANMLSHKSVKLIGFRNDLPEVMRGSDILVLPSIEEGSALVTYDARACGCVLLVSDASGAICEHMENALIHRAGDVDRLSDHFTLINENRDLLKQLRKSSLSSTGELTWSAAGRDMRGTYEAILNSRAHRSVT